MQRDSTWPESEYPKILLTQLGIFDRSILTMHSAGKTTLAFCGTRTCENLESNVFKLSFIAWQQKFQHMIRGNLISAGTSKLKEVLVIFSTWDQHLIMGRVSVFGKSTTMEHKQPVLLPRCGFISCSCRVNFISELIEWRTCTSPILGCRVRSQCMNKLLQVSLMIKLHHEASEA